MTQSKPIIQISHLGNIGNRIFQYIFARALQARVPGAIVTGSHIPEYGIEIPHATTLPTRVQKLTGHEVNLERVAYSLRYGIIDGVVCEGYFLRLEYFRESKETYAGFLNAGRNIATGYGPDDLVINIRAGDIMGDIHPDYTPLPISYYREIISQSGLRPVFMGQIDGSEYVRRLRTEFSDSLFVPSKGALVDFETIRRSKNIAISVSTFSWLAAWLSDAQRIFLPLSGFYNPRQRRDVDLVPVGDPRYEMYIFPVKKWRATTDEVDMLFSPETEFHRASQTDILSLYKT